MNWRPWIILALMLGVVVVNSALMFFEKVAGPEQVAQVKDEVKDKLAGLPFAAATRRSNFKAFGLPDDLVDAAATQATRILAQRKSRYEQMLKDAADDVGPALCAGGLPQRYAALAFLVKEDSGKRQVVDYESVTYFETQEWYDPSMVQDVYNEVELASPPREASTAMGVSAILEKQENKVLNGDSPWGKGLGGRWSLDRVFANYPDAKRKLVNYFAFMHVLTELANEPGGICG